MKPPKLYRNVYVVAKAFNEDDPSDGLYLGKVYIRARLSLDEFNNPFWQIQNDDENVIDYEFSNLDIYDMNCDWSRIDDPERLLYKDINKHNPDKSFNRRNIKEYLELDEIPF